MRVLILSQYYTPEPVLRLRDLTLFLISRSHEVSVVTTFPSYPMGRIYDGYQWRLLNTTTELGAVVTRVISIPYRGASIVKRAASYFSFAIGAMFLGMLPRHRPDVVYVYHPPLTTGFVAACYNLITGVPFVLDVQDLWPEGIVASGLLREGQIVHRGLQWMERFVYRRARRIQVISPGMKQNLISKGVSSESVSIVSNWGNPDVYRPEDAGDLRRASGWDKSFVVMVAGNLGMTHGLETVLQAAALLTMQSAIRFVMLGEGSALASLKAQAAAQSLPNVQFLPRMGSEEQAARHINAANVMLIHLKPTAGGEFSVPHRIFSYMLCAKPVIAAAQGSTAVLVHEHQCGWICPPANPRELSEVVLEAAADPEEGCRRGRNGLRAAADTYHRSRLLGLMEQTIRAASLTQT